VEGLRAEGRAHGGLRGRVGLRGRALRGAPPVRGRWGRRVRVVRRARGRGGARVVIECVTLHVGARGEGRLVLRCTVRGVVCPVGDALLGALVLVVRLGGVVVFRHG
jgi:hypothetical protein